MGGDNPIGKKFGFKGSDPGIIIGVVKDFNFQSLRLAIEPLALSLLGSEEFPCNTIYLCHVKSRKHIRCKIIY